MGFTPLEGLVMATRSGSVDPGLLTYLLAEDRLTLRELETALYFRSGLRGISGRSGDMRFILAARAVGDERAALAFDVYVARLSEGIGALTAALGGLDALVFAGGVGEHASEVRAAACAPFAWIGLALDGTANATAMADAEIAAPESRIRVLVLHTREELMVARETARMLETAGNPSQQDEFEGAS
jgi:acetate kinase